MQAFFTPVIMQPMPCFTLGRFYGSAIVRTALWGALAATQTTLLYVLVPDYVSQFFTGVCVFVLVVGLVVEGGSG